MLQQKCTVTAYNTNYGDQLVMRVPAIHWEGEKIKHTGGPWHGQRIVRSLKTPKTVVIIMVVANVQGLSKEKWDHISGKALHYGAHLVLLQEVGTAKDFDWHLMGYFRRTSRITGTRRRLAIFSKQESCNEMALVRDARHTLTVTTTVCAVPCRIHKCHSPQRNQVTAFRQQQQEVEKTRKAGDGTYEVYAGYFNRHALRNPNVQKMCIDRRLRAIHDGTENRLHKDWIPVSSNDTHTGVVHYDRPVADHPTVLGALTVCPNTGGGGAQKYTPVSVGAWKKKRKAEACDILEAISQPAWSTTEWLC